MTAPPQHFCLKWNHHQHTLVSLFSSLWDSNTFVDCTLAAGGKQIKAHKMILSACSPYFKEILIEHGDMHPIIILNNIQFSELAAIVEFMYRGEVNVSQDQLPTFLKAANALQIKGLTNKEDEENGTAADPFTPFRGKTLKREHFDKGDSQQTTNSTGGGGGSGKETEGPRSDGVPSYYQSDDSAQSSVRLKVDTDDDSQSHPGPSTFNPNAAKQENWSQMHNSSSFPDTIKQENWSQMHNSSSSFAGLLQQQSRFPSDESLVQFSAGLSKMIQLRRPNATEKDASFKCDDCPKFYRSKTSLNLHKRWECGKEPKFSCPYCDKKCHQKGNLKVHIISRHRDRINPNDASS